MCHASRGPVKMSLSWLRIYGKMAYQYTCSSKRKCVAVASTVIIAICYEGGKEGDAIDVCGPDSGSLTARGKEYLITSCRRYACVIHLATRNIKMNAVIFEEYQSSPPSTYAASKLPLHTLQLYVRTNVCRHCHFVSTILVAHTPDQVQVYDARVCIACM